MKKILLGLIVLAAASTISAQQINPITQATLDAYESLLKENPNDYFTLYQRAMQYYRMHLLDKAQDDIARALECTPDKEKVTKGQEYSLMASILMARHDYGKALEAVDAALALDPGNYAYLYMKGNLCLQLRSVGAARNAFAAMQRLQSRSQEALVGLARADIMEGDLNAAKAKLAQIEELNSSSWLTYSRIGDLYAEMNLNREAATAYLTSFALGTDQQRPAESMFALARKDYPAVKEALDAAMKASPSTLALYLLDANVAYETGHYSNAEKALSTLLSRDKSSHGSVEELMARTLFALDKLQSASEYASTALQLNPRSSFKLTKAEIALAQGDATTALSLATSAHSASPSMEKALIIMARANMALGNNQAAVDNLSQLVMTNPGNLYPLMLRSYAYEAMGDKEKALADRQRAASIDVDSFPGIALKAMAQMETGKALDADRTLSSAGMSGNGEAAYWTAVAFAAVGDKAKAREYTEKARSQGYSNLYYLNSAKGPLTLRP